MKICQLTTGLCSFLIVKNHFSYFLVNIHCRRLSKQLSIGWNNVSQKYWCNSFSCLNDIHLSDMFLQVYADGWQQIVWRYAAWCTRVSQSIRCVQYAVYIWLQWCRPTTVVNAWSTSVNVWHVSVNYFVLIILYLLLVFFCLVYFYYSSSSKKSLYTAP